MFFYELSNKYGEVFVRKLFWDDSLKHRENIHGVKEKTAYHRLVEGQDRVEGKKKKNHLDVVVSVSRSSFSLGETRMVSTYGFIGVGIVWVKESWFTKSQKLKNQTNKLSDPSDPLQKRVNNV